MVLASDCRGDLVVVGDLTVDWFTWEHVDPQSIVNPSQAGSNWEQHRRIRRTSLPGGYMLLADMLRAAAPHYNVITPVVDRPEALGPDRVIQSYCELKKSGEAWRPERTSRAYGFDGNKVPVLKARLPSVSIPARVLLIDDAGNGYREWETEWKPLFQQLKPRWTVIKLSHPLTHATRQVWNFIRPKRDRGPATSDRSDASQDQIAAPDPDTVFVVVNAYDLRLHDVTITPRLSWERTAQDVVRHPVGDGSLAPLATCKHLLIRFGQEGVLYYRHGGGEPTLYFEPDKVEGDRDSAQHMIGLTSMFTAALASKIASADDANHELMDGAIRHAMQAAATLGQLGFQEGENSIRYPLAKCFRQTADQSTIWCCAVPSHRIAIDHQYSWRILETLGDPLALAHRVVRLGVEKGLTAPILRIGGITTVDRREIENIRSMDNLLREYKAATTQRKPLSIAVFGPPGSGKSFLVKELADSILNERRELHERQVPLEFNLSQFTSLDHLTSAFHQIQDRMLKNDLPLVFFDEFDSVFNQAELGWLKYFLAPMQDGEYRDDATVHPLGRAIFVFAGGTCRSFEQFSAPLNADAEPERHRRFVQAKGPDFLSRLRGHIDILGPSETDPHDVTWPVRRAVLLRSQIERAARQLINRETKELAIQEGVLHAFLATPNYVHGARSMEAIIGMSALTGQRRFVASYLPPRSQLSLHVPTNDFLALIEQDRLPDGLNEPLARAIHAAYCSKKRSLFPSEPPDPACMPWHALAEEYRRSCLHQAADIPRKLRRVGMYLARVGPTTGRPPLETIPDNDLDILAKLEHDRFIAERLQDGWRLGNRSLPGKTTPFLEPWDDVPPKYKELDLHAVEIIPKLLAPLGYAVYRLDNGTLPSTGMTSTA